MDPRSTAISLVDWLSVRLGGTRLLRAEYSGCGAALMFHRLHSCPRQQLNHDICCSERGLIELLEYIRCSGIDVVTIDEALRRLSGEHRRYFVVLTFDDGYRDNYTRVLPIMETYGLPFTVFVCSSIIERSFNYWWGGLVALFCSRDDVDIEPMGMHFELRNSRHRQAALRRVTKWVEADTASRSTALAHTFRRYGIVPADLLDQDAMNDEELRRLSESPLATIGGHGFTHRPLASLSESEVLSELFANREHLERVTGHQVVHFAYPFGDDTACTWREAELVRSVGYRSAFSTRIGNLFPQHSLEPFMLPRGSMHPHREAVYHAEAQFAGVHRFLKSRGGSPIHPDTLPHFEVAPEETI